MFPNYLDGAKVLEYTNKGHYGFITDYDENDIPFEMHIFGSGRHGMSVNNRLTTTKDKIDPSVTQWVPLCIEWLDDLFKIHG